MEFARESIFVSAIRTFCRLFFGMVGILLAVFLFSLFYSSFAPSPLLESSTQMDLVPNAEGEKVLEPFSSPVILQIPIHGVIGDPQHLTKEVIENVLLDSRVDLLGHDRVKGILLDFNTPGGTVVDANAIYEMLLAYKERYKVPVYGYIEGLCASGGMYIASAADQLFASSSSTIGSVGVILGPFFNFYDLMGKVGLQARTLTQGIDKDMMNPTRPWKEGEDSSLQAVMAFMYERFVDVVAKGRPRLSRDRLVREYGAQVYDCVTAERLGYIDHGMSSRKEALLALLGAAKIDPKEAYQVVTLTPKHSWVAQLMSQQSPLWSGKVQHSFDMGAPSLPDRFAYLYCP